MSIIRTGWERAEGVRINTGITEVAIIILVHVTETYAQASCTTSADCWFAAVTYVWCITDLKLNFWTLKHSISLIWTSKANLPTVKVTRNGGCGLDKCVRIIEVQISDFLLYIHVLDPPAKSLVWGSPQWIFYYRALFWVTRREAR